MTSCHSDTLLTELDALSAHMRSVALLLRKDAATADLGPSGAVAAWGKFRHADDLMRSANEIEHLAARMRGESC